jgi:hypothetical protein
MKQISCKDFSIKKVALFFYFDISYITMLSGDTRAVQPGYVMTPKQVLRVQW